MRVDIRGSLLIKVIAIFLSVFLALAAVFSVLGMVVGYEGGFYRDEELSFEETSIYQNLSHYLARETVRGYWDHEDPNAYVYDVSVILTDPATGAVLFADSKPDHILSAFTTTLATKNFLPQTDHETGDLPTNSSGESTSDQSRSLPDEIAVTLYFTGYQNGYGYDLALWHLLYQTFYPVRNTLPLLALLSVVTFLAILVFLCCASGHRRDQEGITANWLDQVPLDLYLALALTAAFLNCALIAELRYGDIFNLLFGVAAAIPLYLILLMTLLTLSTRLKLGKFWRNTLCFVLLRALWNLCRSAWRLTRKLFHILPFTWRTSLIVLAVLIVQSILFHWGTWDGSVLLLMLLFDAALLLGAMFFAWQLQKLKDMGKALAEGALETKADTRGMFWDIREHAQHLSAIGVGMNRAVEQRIRSERLKTELITNVSHDIKTPLTSIVNYVDLLQKEELGEQAREYVAVLDRQAHRLKKLTEDLVEASKASTGNMTVSLQPIQVNEIIHQAIGDYDERLTLGKLEVIVSTMEGSVSALADGRLLWRVLDNLLSNVCKYAMAGSRVYIDLLSKEDRVLLSMKNISRDRLNISPDELTERFVRGDASRHAEGSGLGLNIAKSLMELMGGTFAVTVDGDLFKAEISLKKAEP